MVDNEPFPLISSPPCWSAGPLVRWSAGPLARWPVPPVFRPFAPSAPPCGLSPCRLPPASTHGIPRETAGARPVSVSHRAAGFGRRLVQQRVSRCLPHVDDPTNGRCVAADGYPPSLRSIPFVACSAFAGDDSSANTTAARGAASRVANPWRAPRAMAWETSATSNDVTPASRSHSAHGHVAGNWTPRFPLTTTAVTWCPSKSVSVCVEPLPTLLQKPSVWLDPDTLTTGKTVFWK